MLQYLRINNKYYCVDEAIWFVSDNATGPWEVSDTRPDEVDEIPPESEVYNVKYVYIYDSTPEVVYAFRSVLLSEDAARTFHDLLDEGTLPGQLYALAGLYLTDADGFWVEITPYRESPTMVCTFFGCIRGEQPVSDLAEEMVDGRLPSALAGD